MSKQILVPHGGYRKLKSFQSATIVYDLTVAFCERYVPEWRMKDQMVQAARSGRQNIAEGCQASATSKKTEIKLINVARASQEELLLDYEDFLRQKGFTQWNKENPESKKVRQMAYAENRSRETYLYYLEDPQDAANVLICLIHQTNYLLDQQLRRLEEDFTKNGGFTERLYNARKNNRNY
ncbi:MAG: four helix bundle suffix domain-containing protein [Patescibacteria group bacterium]|nr:four helix bundle suffix domain-containing protein [Patescibacteria group bacterium]